MQQQTAMQPTKTQTMQMHLQNSLQMSSFPKIPKLKGIREFTARKFSQIAKQTGTKNPSGKKFAINVKTMCWRELKPQKISVGIPSGIGCKGYGNLLQKKLTKILLSFLMRRETFQKRLCSETNYLRNCSKL